ncbi:hypothetical protein RFI_20507, partial [Reticulomyxa filosa]
LTPILLAQVTAADSVEENFCLQLENTSVREEDSKSNSSVEKEEEGKGEDRIEFCGREEEEKNSDQQGFTDKFDKNKHEQVICRGSIRGNSDFHSFYLDPFQSNAQKRFRKTVRNPPSNRVVVPASILPILYSPKEEQQTLKKKILYMYIYMYIYIHICIDKINKCKQTKPSHYTQKKKKGGFGIEESIDCETTVVAAAAAAVLHNRRAQSQSQSKSQNQSQSQPQVAASTAESKTKTKSKSNLKKKYRLLSLSKTSNKDKVISKVDSITQSVSLLVSHTFSKSKKVEDTPYPDPIKKNSESFSSTLPVLRFQSNSSETYSCSVDKLDEESDESVSGSCSGSGVSIKKEIKQSWSHVDKRRRKKSFWNKMGCCCGSVQNSPKGVETFQETQQQAHKKEAKVVVIRDHKDVDFDTNGPNNG